MFAGHWKQSGCCVESFIPKALLFDATRLRRSAEVRRAGTTILTHVLGCRHFLQAVCRSFHDQVLNSHGNHIDQRVRDSAAWVFWLPRILIDPRLKMGASEKDIAKSLWAPIFAALDILLAYIAGQLDMFAWPPLAVVQQQYFQLMRQWSSLLEVPSIRKQVYKDHRFSWQDWWRLAHTDVRFAPCSCAATFHMFHYFGMMGVSEAYAEAIGSLLTMSGVDKRKGRMLTSRIRDNVFLRTQGLRGDGSEDLLLTRCWAEFFGGCSLERYSFEHKSRTAKSARKRYFAGGGSKTIHTYLKQTHAKWSGCRVRKLRRLGVVTNDGRKHVLRAWQWRKELKHVAEA